MGTSSTGSTPGADVSAPGGDIATVWDHTPDAALDLAAEVYTRVGEPAPEALPDDQPVPLATVVARRDGELLAWAGVFRDEEHAAWIEPVTVARLAHHLNAGVYDDLPSGPDEVAAFAAMFRHAAEEMRRGGFSALRWSGEDTCAAGQVAAALKAATVREVGRIWHADIGSYSAPKGLPEISVHPLPWGGLETEGARVEVEPGDERAYVNASEAVSGDDVDVVAALVAELVGYLGRVFPKISSLSVFEVESPDGVVRRALERAGLTVGARAWDYELRL